MTEKKTALLIGAGPAGLTAAYYFLKETDIKPIVIEKEDFIGGISRTAEHNGNRIDIGGHRFFSKNKSVMDLWTNLMPLQDAPGKGNTIGSYDRDGKAALRDPEAVDRVMLLRQRVSRIFYLRRFFDYPISLSVGTFVNLGLANTLKAGFGYCFSAVFKRKEDNLEDFLVNRFGWPLYRMFFRDYTEKVWGRAPRDISADWGAQRIKGLSLLKTVLHALSKLFGSEKRDGGDVETSLIEQFYYPKKGPGQLWELMALEIRNMGGEIHLQTEASGIRVDTGMISGVTVKKGERRQVMQADYYLSSMPVSELIGSMENPVPAGIRDLAENLPYRDFITVGLLVEKLKIRNTGKNAHGELVPDCWIYVQEGDVRLGRVQIFNNWSPYMVKDYENTVWIGLEYFCDEGDALWNMTDESFIAFAVREAEKIGLIEEGSVRDSVRIKVEKAYPAYLGTYDRFHEIREYLDSVGNLYCIGRNGQHRYNNMDHSMATAMEAVRLIREGISSRQSLWDVNTEAEYHEKA